MAAPTLTSSRLTLRPAGQRDMPMLHAHWNRPGVGRYLWDGEPVNEKMIRGAIEQSDADFARAGFGLWILESTDGGAFIGFCGLRVLEGHNLVEVLYSLEPGYWGKGCATEAAQAVVDYAAHTLGLRRIVGGVDPPNVASRRVLDRLGMRYYETLILDGKPADYYELVDEPPP